MMHLYFYKKSVEFFVTTDPKERARQRAKARKLKHSHWWYLQLQKGECYYCGERFEPTELTMDHKIPLARGGKSSRQNIVPACHGCNSAKQHRTATEWGGCDPN